MDDYEFNRPVHVVTEEDIKYLREKYENETDPVEKEKAKKRLEGIEDSVMIYCITRDSECLEQTK